MTIKRHSLRDQIREVLLQRIGSGELNPGDRVVEAPLSREFGVSSIPIREAIRELVAIGVLEFANHKGAWVREVSFPETIDALQVKAVLEGLAAETATARLQGNCAKLRSLDRKIKTAARQQNFRQFQEHNHAFHRTILEASENTTLVRTWLSLAFEVRTHAILDYLASDDSMRIAQEHLPIVDAFDRGDAKGAAQLLTSHSHHLVEYLRREHGAKP